MDDFHCLVKVPAFAANYPVGHGGTCRQPYGGEFTVPALAWLKWQLQDDDKAAKCSSVSLVSWKDAKDGRSRRMI